MIKLMRAMINRPMRPSQPVEAWAIKTSLVGVLNAAVKELLVELKACDML